MASDNLGSMLEHRSPRPPRLDRSWSLSVDSSASRIQRNVQTNLTRTLRSRWGWCVLLLLALFPWAMVSKAHAESVNDLKPTGYVNDFAGVLSPDTRTHLEQLCTEVDQQAHAQIAVVTIKTTGDDTIDDFAVQLEQKWKVGQKGTDRGLLFLIATDDHHYRFEVGYGLEGVLPDGKVEASAGRWCHICAKAIMTRRLRMAIAGRGQRDCARCRGDAKNSCRKR